MPKPVAVIEAVPHIPEADTFDFTRSWVGIRQACAAHKLLIVATCLCTVMLTFVYIRVWPPTYVAEVSLVGESEKDTSRASFYGVWDVFHSDPLTNEAHILTSATVLSAVIKQLNLTEDQVYHSFLGYISYLWVTSWVGETYHHFKDWLFQPARGPYQPTEEEIKQARVLHAFKRGVNLERVEQADIGNLVVRGPTPRVGEIANTIVRTYLAQRRDRHVAEAENAYEALLSEQRQAEADVQNLENRLRDYYSANQMLLDFEKDKIDIGQVTALKSSIVELESSIAGKAETLRQLDAQLAGEEESVVASRVTAANPLVDTLKASLAALQIERKKTLINYRRDSPEIADLDRQIAIVAGRLNQEPANAVRQSTTVLSSIYETIRTRAGALRADLAGERATLEAKTAAYAELKSALQTIPEKMQVVHNLTRAIGEAEQKLHVIQEKMMIAAVSRATARTAHSSIQVIDPATAPGEPVWPMSKLLLIGAAMVGLFAGVLLALLMDLFFGRVHRFRLAGNGRELPIYAIVQHDQALASDLFGLPSGQRRVQRSLSWWK
jgi:uncharacterized protein involved in exopolysaccharide biosynthesis